MLLFLAYLGALTGEGHYTSLAESALASLRRMIDRGRSTFKAIGYSGGWGGIIYTYVHLHALWSAPICSRRWTRSSTDSRRSSTTMITST